MDEAQEAQLLKEDDEVIEELQRQIESSGKSASGWKFDPEGWRKMPLFMDQITEKDLLENEMCAGLSAMVYDGVPPEEIAEGRKKVGNECITRAINPTQERASNWARQAIYAYTEGLDAACTDPKLNAQLYANRSMAQYLIQNYGKGLADAQRAVLLDPLYIKAYYRGAKCAECIRKYDIAKTMISKALELGPDAKARAEFEAIAESIKQAEGRAAEATKKDRLKQRSTAAHTSNLVKDITSKGIRVSSRSEVQSEQWAQLSQEKPYFDEEGVLHVPILFMYDEYSTTDFLRDVPTDCSLRDCLESELMPFPWDDKQRYREVGDLAAVFIVDDGVAMPRHYSVDLNWSLFEIFRSKEYIMPCLVPVFHIVPKLSPLITEWNPMPVT